MIDNYENDWEKLSPFIEKLIRLTELVSVEDMIDVPKIKLNFEEYKKQSNHSSQV